MSFNRFYVISPLALVALSACRSPYESAVTGVISKGPLSNALVFLLSFYITKVKSACIAMTIKEEKIRSQYAFIMGTCCMITMLSRSGARAQAIGRALFERNKR